MASRLSEESLVEILDAGWRSLPAVERPSGESSPERRTSSGIAEFATTDALPNLDELLSASNPTKAVQRVAPRQIYLAIVECGIEDAMDVLPLLSARQFQKIMDYEAWEEDRVSLTRANRWLELYRSLSPRQLAERFRSLDEEYQLAVLSPLIEVVDEEEYERIPDHERDRFHALPCGTMHYALKTPDDSASTTFVEGLIAGGLEVDVGWTYSVLSHAAWIPPNEQEELALQFRNARIEEDGFVPYAESVGIFILPPARELAARWSTIDGHPCSAIWREAALQAAGGDADVSDVTGVEPSQGSQRASGHRSFFDRVLAYGTKSDQIDADFVRDLQQRVAHLANTVCGAARVEPDNVAGIRSVARHVEALFSLGLEAAAVGDEVRGVLILRNEYPRALFQFGLGLVDDIRGALLRLLRDRNVTGHEELKRLWLQRRFGLLLAAIDRHLLPVFGLLATESLKGLCNRFPLVPVESSTFGVNRAGAVSPDSMADGAPARVVFKAVASLRDLGILRVAAQEIAGEAFELDLESDVRLSTMKAAKIFVTGTESGDRSPREDLQ